MPGTFGWIALFAFLAAFVNALGILMVFRYRERAEKIMAYLMCFAAGVLITTPLMLALPEAVRRYPHAGFLALAGFLFMFFSNRMIRHFTHEEALAFGITAAQGIGIHSFVDGLVYTITFKVSVLVGVLSAGGLVAHEFAEGAITYLVLIKGGMEKRAAMVYAFLIASLTTPSGLLSPTPSSAPWEGRSWGCCSVSCRASSSTYRPRTCSPRRGNMKNATPSWLSRWGWPSPPLSSSPTATDGSAGPTPGD